MSAGPRIAIFVGGAHKAGTTALYQALCRHPELVGHAQPELTFFVDDEAYRAGFEARAWRQYVPRASGARRFAGKHVKLLYRRLALERLRAHSPDCRLVLVLRHPVERAHSAYWHARAHGREECASFEQGLAAEEPRLAAGMAPWHDTAYVRNGRYAGPLADALEVFGRERARAWLLEDLRERPRELVRELYAFAGVDPGFDPELERGVNRARRARSPGLAHLLGRAFDSRARVKRAARALLPDRVAVALRAGLVRWNTVPLDVPELRPATRAALLARFRDSNARVAELLGRDLGHWER